MHRTGWAVLYQHTAFLLSGSHCLPRAPKGKHFQSTAQKIEGPKGASERQGPKKGVVSAREEGIWIKFFLPSPVLKSPGFISKKSTLKTGLTLWKQHLQSVSKVLMLWGGAKSSLFQIVDDSFETSNYQKNKNKTKKPNRLPNRIHLPNRRYELVGFNQSLVSCHFYASTAVKEINRKF